MNTIPFITSNAGKVAHVRSFIKELSPNLDIEQVTIELPEIQSLDIHEVAVAKAHEAYNTLKRPLLVDDGGIFLHGYNSFPGALAKLVIEGIGIEGVLMLARKDPRASFRLCLVYIDGPGSFEVFEGRCDGQVVQQPRGTLVPSLPYRPYFVPEGSTKTLAELEQTGEHAKYEHRRVAVQKFVEWYGKRTASSTS